MRPCCRGFRVPFLPLCCTSCGLKPRSSPSASSRLANRPHSSRRTGAFRKTQARLVRKYRLFLTAQCACSSAALQRQASLSAFEYGWKPQPIAESHSPLNGNPRAPPANQHPPSSSHSGPLLPNRRRCRLANREDQTAAEGPVPRPSSHIPHAISITPIFRRPQQGGFCKLCAAREAAGGHRVGTASYVPSVSI